MLPDWLLPCLACCGARTVLYVMHPRSTWYWLILVLKGAWCMQVLGCAKGVVATVVSVLLFRNQVTALGALGYFLTVVGVFAYSWTKKSAAKQ